VRKIYWQIGSIVSLLVINTFWSIEPAKACSCDFPNSPQEAMKRSSRTFIGKVLSFEKEPQGNDEWIATLAVSRVWKGERKSRIIVRTSHPRPAACGTQFVIGERYIVYSSTFENKEYTNSCATTHWIDNVESAEIRALGKGRMVR
jgi:hypothetical protein